MTYRPSFKGEDVAFLILPIIGTMLLDGIVREMDEYVVRLLQVILLTWHTDVAFFEVVALVLRGDHDPKPDVELALVDQQWLLNVLLKNKNVWFYVRVDDRAGLGFRLSLTLCLIAC